MKKLKTFAWIAYMALSIICTVTLATSLFVDCANVITQLTLLIQGVCFAFVSGIYLGM